ncbi:hypothetical protein D9M68_737050 [compost metagenome]
MLVVFVIARDQDNLITGHDEIAIRPLDAVRYRRGDVARQDHDVHVIWQRLFVVERHAVTKVKIGDYNSLHRPTFRHVNISGVICRIRHIFRQL